MDSRKVCLAIMQAEAEREVDGIIESVPELSNANNWHAIDGRETNFNVVTNQASTGSKALTELCTNMVDAVLMKHAYIKGIEPTSADAPQSVTEGVRELVKLKGARSGILAEVDDPKYLQEFAEENLILGVTGGTRRADSLCFTFVDNGEGQHPCEFENTFLSLSKGNKTKIPFVQGKYNMGSSGVLTYCGRRWYKLIVSRRYDASGNWGWTLVRRRPGDGMPVAEYFRPTDDIPSFSAQIIHPMRLKGGEQDNKVNITTGTVVKLFDYQMESAASFSNIRASLNENLVSTILPFRLMDYRFRPDPKRGGRRAQGVDERPVNGMEFLLLRKDGEDESDTNSDNMVYEPGQVQFIGNLEHPDLGLISVRAIVLGRTLPGWLKPPRNTSRVFHTVNGQVQYKQNRAYLSRSCKFQGLRDRVVIISDASDLSEGAHNDVWKGDRENIRATEIGQLYLNEVTKIIRRSEYLKELQHRITREETENLVEESQVTLFQDLVDTDPSIAQLLPGGSLVKLPGYKPDTKVEEWKGKYSPTFLELAARSLRQDGADIAVDGHRVVAFKTDATNNYLTRPDNRGKVFIIDGPKDKFAFSNALRNGRLTLTFTALQDRLVPGEKISLCVAMQDDAMPEPVTENLELAVVATRRTQPPGKPSPPEPNIPSIEDDETTEGRALPQNKWLTRDGRLIGEEQTETERWPEGFTDQDGGQVRDLGDNAKVYCINYDNAHFHQFLFRERSDIDKKVVTEQYRIGMLVLMMGLEDAFSRMEQNETKFTFEDHIDEIRRLAAQGAATVVMSIAKTLPTIINPASVADPDDD